MQLCIPTLTVLLHHRQELDDDLRGGLDQHLPLAPLLCVEHALQSIVEHADSHHGAGLCCTGIESLVRFQPDELQVRKTSTVLMH